MSLVHRIALNTAATSEMPANTDGDTDGRQDDPTAAKGYRIKDKIFICYLFISLIALLSW